MYDCADHGVSRITFFFLNASAAVAWSGMAADFYVYFPPDASRFKVFAKTTAGIFLGGLGFLLVGIGLGSGALTNPAWKAANEISAGALVVEGFAPLAGFGKFCAVIMSFGPISGNIAGKKGIFVFIKADVSRHLFCKY